MSRRKKRATNPRTVVLIVQDKSGSMMWRQMATIDGYNEYLETLQNESEGEVLLTLTQFDTQVRNLFTSRKLEDVQKITAEDYQPGGSTALYDATCSTIHAAEPTIRKDDKVVVVIMTDGQENSSVRYSFRDVTQLLDEKREAGWEILFLGAGEDAWAVGRQLGFDYNHSINYGTVDAHDHTTAFADLATSNAIVTRSATAQAASAYLSSSPVKVQLEAKAKDEIDIHIRRPQSRSRSRIK